MDTPQATATAQAAQTATSSPVVVHKKLSQNLINLIILFIISALLLLDIALTSSGLAWEQLRFFTSSGNSGDLLTKLLPIRVGLAFVFFWYGIDNIEHPEIFNNLGNLVLKKMHLERDKIKLYPFGYFQSALEILVGISLVTGIFMDLGALIGSLLLMAVLFAYEEGLGSLLIRDIGLLGAMVSLFLIAVGA